MNINTPFWYITDPKHYLILLSFFGGLIMLWAVFKLVKRIYG